MEKYDTLLHKAQRGIEVWKTKLGKQQKELVNKGIAEATISKIAGGKEKVGHDTLHNFVEGLTNLLLEHHYQWKPHALDFMLAEYADLHHALGGKFEQIAGIYEMFHKANEGAGILKNILQLHADGNVTIQGQWGNIYHGKAHNFLTNMVSINIRATHEYEFHHQICFNIGNYLMAGGERVERIYAVSTTVTLDNIFSANLRVLIRRHPSAISLPYQYSPNTPEWDELNQTHAGLTDYLSENSILRQTKKVNENF